MNGPTKEMDADNYNAKKAATVAAAAGEPAPEPKVNYAGASVGERAPSSEYATVVAARPCVAGDDEFDPSTPKYVITYRSGIKEAVPHG